MTVIGYMRGGSLYIDIQGEMDECSSADAREKCDRLIEDNLNCKRIIIDLSKVEFMDSTGIGFLIGRYKKTSRLSLPLFIKNPNFTADKVLSISGIYSLIPKVE
jgi:stage II sporulation protein AA (anti-sigma F factor antagonist)